jgi:hypothetical protein
MDKQRDQPQDSDQRKKPGKKLLQVEGWQQQQGW